MRPLPDPMTRKASNIFNVPCHQVTDKMRSYAKQLAYAENYNVSQQFLEHMEGYKQRAADSGNRQ